MSDARDTEAADEAYGQALQAARQIAVELNREWELSKAPTRVSVDVPTGADEQPVFTFTLLLDLHDDFDAEDWPAAAVEKLSEQVRSRLVGSPVDDWDWLVTARAAAPVE